MTTKFRKLIWEFKEEVGVMDNYVLVIERAYGSGGKYIAQKLSERLGIPLVDRELLELASDDSGINEAYFNLSDEKVKKSTFGMDDFFKSSDFGISADGNLFDYQAKILRSKAMKDTFIVIGRASSYILRKFPNVFIVNIQAPFADCVSSIITRKGVSEKQAIKDVNRINEERANFYKYHTRYDWTLADNYDLIINSSRIGRDECVDLIINCAESKLKIKLKK